MDSERFESRDRPFDIVEVGEDGPRGESCAQLLELAADRGSLQPGFYLVVWLKGEGRRSKGGRCRCFGPFPSAKPARALLTTALQWGLVDVAPASQLAAPRLGTPSPSLGGLPPSAPRCAASAHSL